MTGTQPSPAPGTLALVAVGGCPPPRPVTRLADYRPSPDPRVLLGARTLAGRYGWSWEQAVESVQQVVRVFDDMMSAAPAPARLEFARRALAKAELQARDPRTRRRGLEVVR